MGALAPLPPQTPEVHFFLLTNPSPLFYSLHFSRSSFFAQKLHRNTCYERLLTDATDGLLPIYYKRGISDPFSLEGDCGMHCSFLCGPSVFEGCLKYKLFSVAKK